MYIPGIVFVIIIFACAPELFIVGAVLYALGWALLIGVFWLFAALAPAPAPMPANVFDQFDEPVVVEAPAVVEAREMPKVITVPRKPTQQAYGIVRVVYPDNHVEYRQRTAAETKAGVSTIDLHREAEVVKREEMLADARAEYLEKQAIRDRGEEEISPEQAERAAEAKARLAAMGE